jgi:hypothetical protein
MDISRIYNKHSPGLDPPTQLGGLRGTAEVSYPKAGLQAVAFDERGEGRPRNLQYDYAYGPMAVLGGEVPPR